MTTIGGPGGEGPGGGDVMVRKGGEERGRLRGERQGTGPVLALHLYKQW